MDELALQKLIVDAVNGYRGGGFAYKANNRFLVGVADLVVKLGEHPMGILEVKKRNGWPKSTQFALDVTRPQRLHLARAYDAGVPTGVVSFIYNKIKGRHDVWVQVVPWISVAADAPVIADPGSHVALGTSVEWNDTIVDQLNRWLKFMVLR